MKDIKFIRMKEVLEKTGVKSKQTIYNWMDKGMFPKSIKVCPRIVVWNNKDVDIWMKELIS